MQAHLLLLKKHHSREAGQSSERNIHALLGTNSAEAALMKLCHLHI
jgi:hypothetical protein